INRAILNPRQQNEGGNSTEQGAKHVFLSIPGVALGAEKANGGIAAEQRGPPFNELVKALMARQTQTTRKGCQLVLFRTCKRTNTSRVTMAGTKPCMIWPRRS